MPRTTVNQAMAVNQPYDIIAANQYRNQYPLLYPIPGYEKGNIRRNTKLLSVYDIDTSLPLNFRRMALTNDQYVELAILGAEAFLATANHHMVPQNIRRFVRQQELPRLKKLTATEPGYHPFVGVMSANTAWVDSLLELLERL
ncbi:hypothetical protein CDV36_016553 [Fusarium kuroshium]|uniref:Uncharacterized protein n=1 Tax=Fusarium kuroshium TaxID=2010991 RepID=A0A3M2QLB7_9HYPO|nr:hypothetical protein CDV36_016553 [Fusarium kuroshium]